MKTTNNLVGIVLLLTVAFASAEIKNKGWWNQTVFYQIYPRSFQDSNNDGVGDLKGITSKLDHFNDIGVGAIWLSPIYKSPMVDFGYDIEDFLEVDPVFGTSADLKELAAQARKKNIKLVLDLVPNHTADKHKWFQLSINRTGKYADYYIWNDGIIVNGTGERLPPNNWVSVFNGSAWTWNEQRRQFYYHQFYYQQPDLNYNNPDVQQEMKDVLKFWLDQGVDGFRIDAVPHLIENNITQDEPLFNNTYNTTLHASYNHIFTKDQPETYKLVQSWRDYVDQYAREKNEAEKVILTEAYTSWEHTIEYYNSGAHVPFNFKFIVEANDNSKPADFQNIINKWMQMMPKGQVPNWVMGNHDRVRLGTRYPGREDQMVMLEMLLPGVAVTYYGEEIGMLDDTELRIYDFRDGCRTPFQWDDTTNAGFSNASKTWLPVHKNYKELNLKKQKADAVSHYKLYKALTTMRKSNVLRNGNLSLAILNEDVLAVVRNIPKEAVTLLINFSPEKSVTVNLTSILPYTNAKVTLTNVGSTVQSNTNFASSKVTIPPKGSIVLHSGSSIASCSVLMILVLALGSYFRS
ncbi:maltase 1-like isoform X1 [Osmia bicornis bicornis]|uniref:maltase 1-like isoform X1 n=1 Tax=Osmia bicornis bicornis TaxID=1437191 RepID=UPI001EAEBC24|nr:maltase 1-like isoform X1 [Osmia bicornis bicornis]